MTRCKKVDMMTTQWSINNLILFHEINIVSRNHVSFKSRCQWNLLDVAAMTNNVYIFIVLNICISETSAYTYNINSQWVKLTRQHKSIDGIYRKTFWQEGAEPPRVKRVAIYSIHTRGDSHVNDLSNGVLHLYFLHFIFLLFRLRCWLYCGCRSNVIINVRT